MPSDEERTDNAIARLLSVLNEQEKSSIPPELLQIATGKGAQGWSPASKFMALRVIRDLLGEEWERREEVVGKWKRFWDKHPEIHF